MKIGIPTEIKDNENRVGIVPAGVDALVRDGQQVAVERGCGLGSGIPDDEYVAAGAQILDGGREVYDFAELIIKVKEPLPSEYTFIRPDHVLYTYFHFAAAKGLTDALRESGATCIAYETVEDAKGALPLLVPMSEVAGRMSIQEGAKYLEKPMMGRGILLAGVPGVAPAKVLILGGGVVGTNAAKIAAGLGAQVTIMDINLDRLRYLDDIMPPNVTTLFSNDYHIRDCLRQADLVIGAVLIAGAKAPVLVSRARLSEMKPGSVIIDVAVDQGGCVETCRPTTHSDPTFIVDGVVHYCVANMPGAVGRTSTYALTNATLPLARLIARAGKDRKAILAHKGLACGVNLVRGHITHKGVAETFGYPYHPLETVLA